MNPARAALAELRVHGWTQGRLADSSGRLCLVGALVGCAHLEGPPQYIRTDPAIRIIAQVIREQYPESADRGSDGTVIIKFNDARGRTQDEVERVLEKAAVAFDDEVLP